MEDSSDDSEGVVSNSRNNEFLKKSKTIKINLTKKERDQLKQITYVDEEGRSHLNTDLLLLGFPSKAIS